MKKLLALLLLPATLYAKDPAVGTYRIQCGIVIYTPAVDKLVSSNRYEGRRYDLPGYENPINATHFLKSGQMICSEDNGQVFSGGDFPILCFRTNLPKNRKVKGAAIVTIDDLEPTGSPFEGSISRLVQVCDVTKNPTTPW